MPDQLAGRAYARIYRVSGRADLRQALTAAVAQAGGTVLYASDPHRAPLYLGVQAADGERLGLLCYLFRCNPPPIRGRAADEHRLQIRYGAETSWSGAHPLGRDVAGIDVTLVLGVHTHAGILVGLDPLRYDPLPMGISIEFKDAHVAAVVEHGWHVWERTNQPGRRRPERRAQEGLETLVGFQPERLLDYARLERQATSLGLDPPLRFRAALVAASAPSVTGGTQHMLEEEFAFSSAEILHIIATRTRLAVAVRGGGRRASSRALPTPGRRGRHRGSARPGRPARLRSDPDRWPVGSRGMQERLADPLCQRRLQGGGPKDPSIQKRPGQPTVSDRSVRDRCRLSVLSHRAVAVPLQGHRRLDQEPAASRSDRADPASRQLLDRQPAGGLRSPGSPHGADVRLHKP
jgi:restriction-modification system family protein